MKLVHNIEMRVFCYSEDNEKQIIKKIKEIFPFEFKKIDFSSKITYGFEEKKIKILTVFVKAQTNKVLKNIFPNLDKKQKLLLLKQIDTRLDESLHFYIRLDKEKLLNNEYEITDSGNCFRFKFCIAAFPHKREIARLVVRDILSL